MRYVELAIVIPTLNEEKYIGTLLDSIFHQSAWPKEIVVVDAESSDKTRQVVAKYQARLPQLQFVQIPKYTISRQRNYGASLTQAAHILFLDADMNLKDKDTLEKYLQEVEKLRPDIAAATNLPDSASWKDRLYFIQMNLTMKAMKPFAPWTTGMNMYIKRSSFDKVQGFDEEVRVAEDMEIVQRMVKHGFKFIFLDQPKIYTSVRRFIKEGRRKFTWKVIKGFLAIRSKGYQQANIEYEFGDWASLPKSANRFERLIKEMEKRRFTQAILRIGKKFSNL